MHQHKVKQGIPEFASDDPEEETGARKSGLTMTPIRPFQRARMRLRDSESGIDEMVKSG
jgi:hypothetical protein